MAAQNSRVIDIGVGGRFHADQMFSAFQSQGDEVNLYTSYPASRFPQIPSSQCHSFIWPEIVFRGLSKIGLENRGDLSKMVGFGRRMSAAISRRNHRADFFFGWSSFSVETLRLKHAVHSVVLRDSAHIQFQNQILQREYEKHGIPYPDRSLCEERELEEYSLAGTIFVLSNFAKKTFVDKGVEEEKIHILPLAVDLSRFKPVDRERNERSPLKLLYFGNLSIQKGVHHLLKATESISPQKAELTLIGAMDRAFAPLCEKYHHARVLPAMPQSELAKRLPEYDVFVFPTLHDGFGQTLLQAMACGLVPIVSNHCGAADHIENGKNGWIFPAGDVPVLRQHLYDIIAHRDVLRPMREEAIASAGGRPWSEYHRDLLSWTEEKTSPPRSVEMLSSR